MHERITPGLALFAALVLALASPALCAEPAKLLLEDEGDPVAVSPATIAPDSGFGEIRFIGAVIFVRGSQVVAEIADGAVDNEQVIVYDEGLRRRGKAAVLRPLKGNTYLLRSTGGTSLAEGNRLSRESEAEAAARVIRENRAESYRAFLDRFPNSEHRPRMARELFRLAMKEDFPASPGTSIRGSVRLSETVSRAVSRDQVQIVLDRFVVTLTDEGGQFRIDGVPKLEETVRVKLRTKDPKFEMSQEVELDLPAGTIGDLEMDLPVRLTPTVLSGQVLDETGEPLAGAEVWTSPYSVEFLTDEQGAYRISRKKKLDRTGVASSEDEPIFGGDYEVYARRSGYSVERIVATTQSFRENELPSIRLIPQDSRREPIPELALNLRNHLRVDPSALVIPRGPTPMINP